MPQGLATQLGTTYADGAELSGGQWQRLAIARGMMPDTPLCLVPEAGQLLFDAYHRAAKGSGRHDAITVLISHRFSSVKMADAIVVLDAGRSSRTSRWSEPLRRRCQMLPEE